ncbi:MAG TPA: tetratricopeptide repeat protein [Silvibacterium sp.]|nr:tetratricopeptide repeat protein [Silvibacterium sp.]
MQTGCKKKLAALITFFIAAASTPALAAPNVSLETARVAFNHGRADDALRALDSTLKLNPEDAAAWNLQCRVYLSQGRWDAAVASCQRAVQIAPVNSEFHVWMGRAYGEKARQSSLVAAYKIAKLVHSEFETAVRLDGKNPQALSDLGQYYVEAPRMLGGGYAKAQEMAQRLNPIDPVRAEELRALIAEAKKDYADSERSWRARIAASQSSPDTAAQAWIDMGSFFRRRGRFDEMLAALKSGAAADTDHGPALVDGASTLIEAGREPKLAEQWLRAYLDGNHLSDTAPAFAVHVELGDLLKKQGDVQAANRQFAAAHAMSATYPEPATISTGE